jgi:hypothetical protein
MDDKDLGRLIGKGIATGDLKDSWGISTIGSFTLNFTVSIFVKDGKYKYEITDFNSEDNKGGNLWSIHKYDISELAADPKHKKDNGDYKKDVLAYIKLTDKIGTDLSATIKQAMSATAKDF